MKRIFYIIIGIIALYILYIIGDNVINGYRTDWKGWKNYTLLFNDSIRKDIDTFTSCSDIGRNDVITNFIYIPHFSEEQRSRHYLIDADTTFLISFWEFMSFKNININDVQFRENQNLYNLQIKRGTILGSKSIRREGVSYNYHYKHLTINTDSDSEIFKKIKGKDYKGFIGTISRISLSNEKNKHYIYIDYVPKRKYVLFLVYKHDSRFFIIIIDSLYHIDESMLRILNLK